MSQPKIVFLDASTVDLGDIVTQDIQAFGEYIAYAQSNPAQMALRGKDAEVIITNKNVFQPKLFKKFPKLKLLCVAATGVNNIDLAAAKKQGVAVCNVAGYSTTTVAEHALMFLLAISHRLTEHHQAVLAKKWSASPHFALLAYPFQDLAGKTLAIVGYGTIGKRVAELAEAFQMKVLLVKLPGRTYPAAPKRYALELALSQADYVSLHCPLSEQTQHLLNHVTLRLMKPGASLLNLARGPIVDEQAVSEVLQTNHLAYYATDVASVEPMAKKHPLLHPRIKNKVLITPHVAWASQESRQKLFDEMVQNIKAFYKGERRNRVV